MDFPQAVLSCDLRSPVHTEIAACRGKGRTYMLAEASIAGTDYCQSNCCPYREQGHEAVLHAQQLCDEEFGRLSDADVHQLGAAADGIAVPGSGADIFAMDHLGGL